MKPILLSVSFFIISTSVFSQHFDGPVWTADIISYMTYQGEKDIFLCALLQPASDNKSYVNLEFLEKYSNHMPVN